MKKILIISIQEYSLSNRSMDTITEYFLGKKKIVKHLVVGRNKLKKNKNSFKKIKIENFEQLFSKETIFSYLAPMSFLFPDFLLSFIKKRMLKTVNFINFKEYDLIVLETGKPLFLLEKIPEDIPLICRQSDPLDISLRSSRNYFLELEKKAFKRSLVNLIAHREVIKNYIELNNLIEWKSGFESLSVDKNKINTKKIISYMGVFKLDLYLIKELAIENPEIEFNIIGNYKDILNIKNIKFHGYLLYNEYIEMLKKSDCFIVPYHLSEVKRMKMLGLTSKYYVAMDLGIPILTRSYGFLRDDIKEYNIYTYTTANEAKIKLDYIFKTKHKKTKKIRDFLENLKLENRKKELERILKKFNINL